jgi:hypothetical protein
MEAKETYYGSKRDLLWKQKRPTMEAKETYYYWSSWQQESRVRGEIKRPSKGKRTTVV